MPGWRKMAQLQEGPHETNQEMFPTPRRMIPTKRKPVTGGVRRTNLGGNPIQAIVIIGDPKTPRVDKPGGMSTRVWACLPVLFKLNEVATRVSYANAMHAHALLVHSLLFPTGRNPRSPTTSGFHVMILIPIAEFTIPFCKIKFLAYKPYLSPSILNRLR